MREDHCDRYVSDDNIGIFHVFSFQYLLTSKALLGPLHIPITQMIYIPYIYMNEFDHCILALLKQQQERAENSGLNGNSSNNFLSFIFPTAKQAEVRTDFYDAITSFLFSAFVSSAQGINISASYD